MTASNAGAFEVAVAHATAPIAKPSATAGATSPATRTKLASATSPSLVLATGGTGGHIFPALAVAEVAAADGIDVLVLGQKGGMEERLTAQAGVPFHGVSAGKWHRGRPSPGQALKAMTGVVEAWQYLRRHRPTVVIGFGGFASYPGCFAAARLKVPLVLHEGNAYPSQVNRWLAADAELVIVAQEQALAHLPRRKRSLVVPFPVRERVMERAAARASLGLAHDAVVTLVMGGSQGSAVLNRVVPAAYQTAKAAYPALEVVHSAGAGNAPGVTAASAGLSGYHVADFLDAPTAWGAADLAITRAGVGTLSEAALNGVPLLMIPLPSSAEDHQLHNAKAVETAGAGIVVQEHELERLPAAWLSLLEPDARRSAAAASAARTPVGAARRILDAVMELT